MNELNVLAPPENATVQTSLASPSPYTDKAGFAKRWGFSRRTVDNLIASGLPHLKIGQRRVRINIPEADAWMQQQYRQQRRAA
jgi:predicted DNA-binding transcriptional regulator AlpA